MASIENKTLRQRNLQYLIIAILIGLMSVTLYIGFRQHASSFDDAYITYRYARNIASGQGFVYNVGEAVLGTTTPLYTLLLAALSFIWSDFPTLSHFIGVLAWMLCVPLIYRIGKTGGSNVVGLIAAIFVAINPLILNILGMETPIYILLILSTFYFYLKDKPLWAAVTAGLTFLVRWDGILVWGVIFIVEILKRKWSIIRASFVCAAIMLVWLIFAYLTFGSIFPNSFFAKMGQSYNEGFGGIEGSFGTGIWLLAQQAYATNHLFIIFPLFIILGIVAVIKDKDKWWPLLLWTVTYLASYIILGVLRFNWYYAPLMPALALLTAKGIEQMAKLISMRLKMETKQAAWTLFFVVLCLIPMVDWLAQYRRTEMGIHSSTYVDVGNWLKENTPPESSVAMIEIGIIGYYGDRTTVDTMGLVSPEMIGHLESWQQTLQYAVNYYWPDYVVGLEQTAWTGIVNQPWFQEAYILETQIENSADPVAPASIYRRRDEFPWQTFDLSSTPSVWFANAFALHAFQVRESQIDLGENLHVRLDWEAERDIERDYSFQFDLWNVVNGQRHIVAKDLRPFHDGNPTNHWRTGDSFADTHMLPIPNDLPAGRYALQLSVIDEEGTAVSANIEDAIFDYITVGPIQIGDVQAESQDPTYVTNATFADHIQLTGYDIEFRTNNEMVTNLYWQASDDVSKDYTIFVHLLSSEGEIIAQHDGQPQLPTTIWQPGVQVTDERLLLLPNDLPEDVYQIRVGAYTWPDGERLSILKSGCLNAENNALLSGTISVHTTSESDDLICPELRLIEFEDIRP